MMGSLSLVISLPSKNLTMDSAASLPAAPVVAVNRLFASLETPLEGGDEVAFVPPVAGG